MTPASRHPDPRRSPEGPAKEARLVRAAGWLAAAVILVGLVWRLTRYLLRFPIWGDEAMLLTNYVSRTYLDFLGPIDNAQIAPLFFHWCELTAIRWLGVNELAVRFFPLLASVASVGLFWALARQTLPRSARPLAVGILAVSIWPATMGSLAKPYTFDLFFSLALLVPATRWLRRRERVLPLWLLAATVPAAVLSSYPSVFIGGAVWLALLGPVLRSRRVAVAVPFALYGVLLLGVFGANYYFVSLRHLQSAAFSTSAAEVMADYWKAGFPPGDPAGFVGWLAVRLTGQIAAYPLGAANGGSILTVLLAGAGVWHLWQRGERPLVTLFAASLGLSFAAAVLHKYPFGTSCRLAQHLAPFYCLLAGLGASTLIAGLREPAARSRLRLAALTLLLLVGLGGIVRDFVHPYRDREALWARDFASACVERAGKVPLLVIDPPHAIPSVLRWQFVQNDLPILPLQRPEDVAWLDGHDDLCLLSAMPGPDLEPVEGWLRSSGWRCVDRCEDTHEPERPGFPAVHGYRARWIRENSGPAHLSMSPPAFTNP